MNLVVANRYRLDRRIGDGGMGVVFEAHDDSLDRSVAVKLIRPEHVARGQAARFLREAKILGQLEHPNIVDVLDIGQDANDGSFFMASKQVKVTIGGCGG